MTTESLPVHYLAVDGPIGVGKTTLVEKLTHRFEGVKILEDVTNPFLPDFYNDRPGAVAKQHASIAVGPVNQLGYALSTDNQRTLRLARFDEFVRGGQRIDKTRARRLHAD